MIDPDADGYLGRLDRRLRKGARVLPESFCSRHLDYLIGLQRPDGGFAGREGASDLYYTHFALQSVDLLAAGLPGSIPRDLFAAGGRYLEDAIPSIDDVIECYCALRSLHILAGHDLPREAEEMKTRALSVLRENRRPHGGYSSRPGGPPKVYQTFLAGLCYEMLGEEPPGVEEDVALVRRCRCPDGGFADTPPAGTERTGGANPTAAALGYLLERDALSSDLLRSTRAFLSALQRTDGGFGAHAQVPVSDLLSTFTVLFTLAELDALTEVRLADAGRFARRLSRPDGGFCGTAVQEEPDAEYTFYGLGCLAVLAGVVERRGAR